MYDYDEHIDNSDEPSNLAYGFGFTSQREFDDYCDNMERSARECEMEDNNANN